MGGLIHIVMFLGALVAFIAWAVAGLAAIEVSLLAPKGDRLNSYFDLGRRRFVLIEQKLGPAASPYLRRYERAFAVFFSAILVIVLVSIISVFL